MKVMITGISGFAGSYLAEYLTTKPEIEIYGLKRWNSPLENIRPIIKKVNLLNFDLGDPHSIYQAIKEVKPDKIFHLAAQSYVPMSFIAPIDTMRANVFGTIHLLEAVRALSYSPIIHVCTSSEVYGQVEEKDLPITEISPFNPQSPYGVSKVSEDLTAQQYYLSYGLKVFRTRSFTHTGPRSKEVFVVPAFAKQIAEIEAGIKQENIIRVGNLNSVRTFLDVRDMVEAYWILSEISPSGEAYNIAGEHCCTIKEMLDYLLTLTNIKPKVVVDPKLIRPSDVTLQVASTSKLYKATGWKPKIKFEQTMVEILNYWRKKVKDELTR